MSLQRGAGRQPNAILRFARWKPASYWQVWLVAAPLMASGVLTGGLVAALWNGGFAADRFLFSLFMAAGAFIALGAVESYRLDKRMEATVYADWVEARDRSRAG